MMKEILNPRSSVGADPWVYYMIYALFVFLFNIFDIVSIFHLIPINFDKCTFFLMLDKKARLLIRKLDC